MKPVLLLATLVILCSCSRKPLSRLVKEDFNNRYEGATTGIREKIRADGYFQYWRKDMIGYNQELQKQDTMWYNIVFYEDGTFLYNFSAPSGQAVAIPAYLQQVAANGKNDLFYRSFFWGIYRLSGDTIIAQCLSYAGTSYNNPWKPGEFRYKVLAPDRLQLVGSRELEGDTPADNILQAALLQNASLLQFYPAQLPPPFSWLKEEKVFWRHEEDWKNYMNALSK